MRRRTSILLPHSGAGTFSRRDFAYDQDHDVYICPAGKTLKTGGTLVNDDATLIYLASTYDAAHAITATKAYERTRRDRKKVEMLFAQLKRILRLGRLRLRGPSGAQFEFTLAAIAQNLRRLAKLAVHLAHATHVAIMTGGPACRNPPSLCRRETPAPGLE